MYAWTAKKFHPFPFSTIMINKFKMSVIIFSMIVYLPVVMMMDRLFFGILGMRVNLSIIWNLINLHFTQFNFLLKTVIFLQRVVVIDLLKYGMFVIYLNNWLVVSKLETIVLANWDGVLMMKTFSGVFVVIR